MTDKDHCAPHHKGADTSVKAFEQTPPQVRSTQKFRLLEAIQARGASGATCEELEFQLSIVHQTAGARIAELVHDNLIHIAKERRKTKQGREARVYKFGPAPRADGQLGLFETIL